MDKFIQQEIIEILKALNGDLDAIGGMDKNWEKKEKFFYLQATASIMAIVEREAKDITKISNYMYIPREEVEREYVKKDELETFNLAMACISNVFDKSNYIAKDDVKKISTDYFKKICWSEKDIEFFLQAFGIKEKE